QPRRALADQPHDGAQVRPARRACDRSDYQGRLTPLRGATQRLFRRQGEPPMNEEKSAQSWPMARVITASSAGTAFEWYDFFILASLTPVISKVFLAARDRP